MPRLVAHSGSNVLRLERIAPTAVAANPTRHSTRRDSRTVVSSFGLGAPADAVGRPLIFSGSGISRIATTVTRIAATPTPNPARTVPVAEIAAAPTNGPM